MVRWCAVFGLLLWLLIMPPVAGHDIYGHWRQPGTGASCCNDFDCHPVRAWPDEEGRWTALWRGREVAIPRSVMLKGPSPDGRSHLCIANDVVLCFMPGEPKS